jgi:protocadherin-15
LGKTIFQAKASDLDTGVNGMIEYSVVPGGADVAAIAQESSGRVADGFGYFSVRLPHQGYIVVNKTLNYEVTTKYIVTLKATVSVFFLGFCH